MTCTQCEEEIEIRESVVVLSTVIAGDALSTARFSGVIWHIACAPVHQAHLANEARAQRRRQMFTR